MGGVLEKTRFRIDLSNVQPSQLYICREKLVTVQREFDAAGSVDPVPVKELDGRRILTDGHTRALATHLRGEEEVDVYWEDEPLDWNAYRVCVEWCLRENIHSVRDLADRIIPWAQYEHVWIERCRRMYAKRTQSDETAASAKKEHPDA